MQIANIEREILHNFSNLRNFNETFWKNVTYGNDKSHKKQEKCFTISFEDTFFKKP